MTSIVHTGEICYLCRCKKAVHCHHIYGGPNRKWSTKFGMMVNLCYGCHEEVHKKRNQGKDEWLKKRGQEVFQSAFPEEDFMRVFGRNYL